MGAYLIALWGLPTPVVRAVAHHHRPASAGDKEFSILTALHVANSLEHERDRSADASGASAIDTIYLKQIGLAQRLDFWREFTSGQSKSAA